MLGKFELRLQDNRLKWKTDEELDECLVWFLDEGFFEGEASAWGTKLRRAVGFKHSRYSKDGGGSLPRTARGLAGYRKLDPARTRLPHPMAVVAAIANFFMVEGRVRLAVGVMIATSFYLRPGELLPIKMKHLSAPVQGGGVETSQWTLTMHSFGEGKAPRLEVSTRCCGWIFQISSTLLRCWWVSRVL
jgi:hypothetical protein